MDAQLLIEYAWIFVVLIGLEGLLAADNALVLAIMVRHLPLEERRKALFYGLIGAFILRFGSVFIISFLVDVWQRQASGALYLIFLSIKHLYDKATLNEHDVKKKESKNGNWMRVLKIEIADLTFTVDSILTAVAIAVTLPATGLSRVDS